MKNYVQKGDVINITAAADLKSGVPVIFGASLAIPQTDIASGAVGAAAIEGVFTLPKLSTTVLAAGDLVNWSKSGAQVGASSAAGDLGGFGIALSAAGNGTTSVDVKLLPGKATIHS